MEFRIIIECNIETFV